MKKIFVVLFAALLLCSCGENTIKRTFDPYSSPHHVYSTRDGEQFYVWDANYYIAGVEPQKVFGVVYYPSHYREKDTLYTVKNSDGNVLVELYDIPTYQKYFPLGLDGGCDSELYIRLGETFDYSYCDPNVQSVAVIPYSDIPKEGRFDYAGYVKDHGIFGDDAKAIMGNILEYRTEEEIFSEENRMKWWEIRQIEGGEDIGRLVFYPDGVDWFCFDGNIFYIPEYGWYLSFYHFSFSDYYHIPDSEAEKLGLSAYLKGDE